MRVGLDVDGVLYPFEDGMRKFLVDWVGYDPGQVESPARKWRFYEDWGMTYDDFKVHYYAGIDAGVVFAFPGPYEGTTAALQSVVDAGHTLHIVTARGDHGSPGRAEQLTREWTDLHLPKIASLTFSDDKTVIASDVFLEDKLENYDALTHAGVRATLINRPWNQQAESFPWRRRVDTIEEFAADVLHLGRLG